jgi:predicted transcriptional regulator
MTPQQLRKKLEREGLSQRKAAHLIGINDRSMRRYIAGDTPIPLVVEYALEYVMARERRRNVKG